MALVAVAALSDSCFLSAEKRGAKVHCFKRRQCVPPSQSACHNLAAGFDRVRRCVIAKLEGDAISRAQPKKKGGVSMCVRNRRLEY